jgi:hypothetical protein
MSRFKVAASECHIHDARMRMTIRSARLLFALAAAVLLAGCAARDPLDYLPDCPLYVCFNVEQMRSQPGAGQILKTVQELGSTPAFEDPERLYVGLRRLMPSGRVSGLGSGATEPRVYGLVTGKPGITKDWLSYFKSHGGEDTTIEGRKCLAFEGIVFLPLNDSAFGFAMEEIGVRRMLAAGRKKDPGAKNANHFKLLQDNVSSHAVVTALNAAPILSQYAGLLTNVAMMNPKAAEALEQVQMAMLSADWIDAPAAQATLTLPDADHASNLGTFAQFGLGALMGFGGSRRSGIESLNVTTEGAAVRVDVALPRETGERLLQQLQDAVAELPDDPQERAVAVARLLALRNPAGEPPSDPMLPGYDPLLEGSSGPETRYLR